MTKYKIGGLYSCNHPLELWKKSSSDSYFSELVKDLNPNNPFVILEIDDKNLVYCNIFQLKILTSDGFTYWIDVNKTNTSIQPLVT